MSSKLDAHANARDFRRKRRRRKRRNEKPAPTQHVDVTSVTYANQLADDGSRFTVLDALPEMDEEWVNEIVFVRSPAGGTDRAYMGVQLGDDSLAWIEITLAAPAPPTTDPVDPVSGTVTYQRRWLTYTSSSETTRRYFDWNFLLGSVSSAGLLTPTQGNDRWQFYKIATGAYAQQGAAGAFNGRMSGIARRHDQARFAIADSTLSGSNARIRIYNMATDPPSIHASSFSLGAAWEIRGIAYGDPTGGGSSDDLYIADATNGLIRKYSVTSGAQVASKSVVGITGLELNTDGDGLYYTSESTNKLHKCPTSLGADTWSTLGTGSGDGQMSAPAGIAYANGRVWVADRGNNRVQAFNPSTGAYLGKFGGTPGTDTTGATIETPWDVEEYLGYLYVFEGGRASPVVWAHISEWLIAADFPV